MKYFTEKNNTLEATFEFQNFSDALSFVNLVGNIAEISNHHPNIYIHDYRYVTISSCTHDSGNTVTCKDKTLAERIESSYKK